MREKAKEQVFCRPKSYPLHACPFSLLKSSVKNRLPHKLLNILTAFHSSTGIRTRVRSYCY